MENIQSNNKLSEAILKMIAYKLSNFYWYRNRNEYDPKVYKEILQSTCLVYDPKQDKKSFDVVLLLTHPNWSCSEWIHLFINNEGKVDCEHMNVRMFGPYA